MNATVEKHLHSIVMNVDYTLRRNEAKFVLIASDCAGEGKSTFLSNCAPILSTLYKKKVLIYDFQSDRNDLIEKTFSVGTGERQFIQQTSTQGLDYVHSEDLTFLNSLPEYEKASALAAHFNEITKDYDVVFINMKTLKRAEKTTLPVLPIDGAILIRSAKSIASAEKFITNELLDREIPILGLIKNEGI
jgi:hypothetical protein